MMLKIASQRVVRGVDDDYSTAPAARPATLTIADEGEQAGWIVAVNPGIAADAELVTEFIVPGFVDTHNHGAAGSSFGNPDLSQVQAAIDHHRRHGATSLIASTVTEAIDEVERQVVQLRTLVSSGELDGIHLEGPFLSEEKKGAHDASLLCDALPAVIDRLLAAGGDALSMVTIAPEREHGLEAISRFTQAGVVAAFGHSDADELQTREAIDAGVTVVTHLFNAMRSIHHRLPGPVPWLLTDNRVSLEVVCDGVHLHPDTIRMVVEAAGVDRVSLITDAINATGQPDGDYELGTLEVRVRQGEARLLTADGSPGPIAGSTLTMDRAVEFIVQQVGLSVGEAAVMAATTPARALGLDEVGSLQPGRRANLCLVDSDGRLSRVMRHGEWLV